ncbi:hypothetical protein DER29_1210 [Micromonospora sp. M71_S20]|uniref:hypothetical protein n=1 Tax=Micromonospora sp. M71_S20 TaxID=592872 RepID=UPI000EB3049E|nr:hypothetical protein [Micromonospora sp. M71_S20]RLK23350.1 hypothetical protein DER29_1210 [Micromonospora sp. M71_S20]
MSEVTRSFRSPLTLLEQWRDRADGARLREVVITGYTVDLGFLEKFAIPTARALGARITVLGDAGHAVHDPVDVRRAGVAYQHGHAVCPRAFHPKLVVLLGDDDVWLTVGSGNPTLSGWGYNRELWVTAHGTRQYGPQLVVDVAEWLHDLPDVVGMASWIAATLRQVADRMRPGAVDERWLPVRAYGNLRRPLLERLPTDPIDELRLAAPFYDPPARAVSALVNRTKPRSVRVAVQPSIAMFDGAALVRATESTIDQEFRLLGPGPAQHGKLIEWDTTDGTTAGMTGSANVTTSALLLSTVQGGNCELAVIAPHSNSLFPEGDPQPCTTFRHLASTPPTATDPVGAAPVLLGCALSDGTLVVELATPAGQRVVVETSPSAVPGSWLAVGAVPVGQQTARFLVPELTGGAVRAVIELDGVRRESAAVFITDPSRCRPRRDVSDEPRLSRAYEPDELFTDPLIAQRFTADLARLVELTGATGRSVPASSTAPVDTGVAPGDRWADYLEDCDRLLGRGLAGLIFPRTSATNQATVAGWSIDDTDESELAEDEDEGVLDGLTEEPDTPSARSVPDIPPNERIRYRRFAARWVASVTEPAVEDNWSTLPPVHLRMTVTALYLTLLAAGVWQEDEDWRAELRWLVWALVPDDAILDELPAEAFEHLYSLLAVAMAMLRQGSHLQGGREADVLASDAWRDASEWVAEADAELAEQQLLPASQPFARVVSARELWDTIVLAKETRQDPYAEARATLKEAGLAVRLDQGVWWAEGEFGNAYRTAARVATELGRATGCVVAVARNPRCTVLIARVDRTMVLVDSRMAVWRLYQLSGTRTPLSMTAEYPGPPPGARITPLTSPPTEVRNLSDQLGVDLTEISRRIRIPG